MPWIRCVQLDDGPKEEMHWMTTIEYYNDWLTWGDVSVCWSSSLGRHFRCVVGMMPSITNGSEKPSLNRILSNSKHFLLTCPWLSNPVPPVKAHSTRGSAASPFVPSPSVFDVFVRLLGMLLSHIESAALLWRPSHGQFCAELCRVFPNRGPML